MREAKTKIIYDFQSRFYDLVVSNTCAKHQRGAIQRMRIKPGQRVLDIGIGTGLSLDVYPSHCHVVGMDLSKGMLGKAQERVRRSGLDNVDLVCADAMFRNFAEGSFDYIVLSHIVSVVSDHVRLMRLAYRLGRPGCPIVIVNHFRSANKLMALLERMVSPLCKQMGWRSDLSLEKLVRDTGLQVDRRYMNGGVDLWETVFARAPELA